MLAHVPGLLGGCGSLPAGWKQRCAVAVPADRELKRRVWGDSVLRKQCYAHCRVRLKGEALRVGRYQDGDDSLLRRREQAPLFRVRESETTIAQPCDSDSTVSWSFRSNWSRLLVVGS
jgi:hypothetical protein